MPKILNRSLKSEPMKAQTIRFIRFQLFSLNCLNKEVESFNT